ncbi:MULTISPECIES: SDR family NAD(P)-dependent oxidoreductase [unclassified Streptomyces]|uniref:SDR family NAD(P)-dependent oxidoreductase n=1 Tax=unclassified Streptomyces TaxID=2593676 RepID=UPI00224D6491|nr:MULTISPECIES: SDR family NAD(P)-dependent oxidoreductase [unclassified Streptomyces]MCX4642019.1 SDR family oxidoreductase [Streptomyces sp. NBC_01446]MCX5085751.1 SDR family oxidoreductase [Streptomyces sp. NBC_00401]MCX5326892.1 SDR family oxidoreductase [Streptomyces sp. NBC_00120]
MLSAQETEKKVAVVTGGAEGLGAEIAHQLAGEEFELALLDLNGEGLESTAAAIRAAFPAVRVLTVKADLADATLVSDAFAEIESHFGRVDALVNTAGGSGTEPAHDIEDIAPEMWSRVLNANVTSAFLCSRMAVPLMRRNGFGRIVNFSSAVANGLSGPSGTVGARLPYAASKAAVIGLTKQLAKDLGSVGITVNVVSPGLILPEQGRVRRVFEALPEEAQVATRAAIPAGRTGTGAEIAAAVAYLVSDEAGFTSGCVLNVDGAA